MKKVVALSLLVSLAAPFSAGAQSVGGGDILFMPNGASKVIFSHKMHVSIKGIKCSGCHYHVFPMASEPLKMTMSKMNKGEFCGKCHNGQKSFDVKDPKNCAKCHK